MTINREDVRRQLELEDEARGLGVSRYNRTRPMPWKDDTPDVEEEANLPPGKALIRLAVLPTAAAIHEFIANANSGKAGRKHSAVKWLEEADPEEVAYITARVALNSAASGDTFQSASRTVATAIIDHVEMLLLKDRNRDGYKGLLAAQKRKQRTSRNRMTAIRKLLANEEAKLAIPVAERLHLGSLALELLIDSTGLFSLDLLPSKNRRDKEYRLVPAEAVQKWLTEQHARSALLDPLLMPMIVRPKRWRSPLVGGYLTRFAGRRFVKNSDRAYQDALFAADMAPAYAAVNHIQETPWRINQRVLAVMREAWDSGSVIAGLPAREDSPLPSRPEDIDTNPDALRRWKIAAAQAHEANAALFTKRVRVQQRLWLAEKFAPESAIWFPHSLDFRGRVYPIPAGGIHPQMDDPSKALLEFAHGLPVGPSGGYWLAVHIANLFGVDKVPFAERVGWTYANAPALIDSAMSPLDGDRFWTTADSPWMALAAIFDFVGFLQDRDGFVSHLPIPLDGSNSGLQHFSAMLRDPVGAAAVNLVPAERPQDVYLSVAERAQAAVDADVDEAAAPWRGGKVSRKIAKRPTMTFVYSATRFGMQDMILQTLRELDAEAAERGDGPYLEGADNYKAAMYLSHVLFGAVSDVVAAASGAMRWLREAAKVAAEAAVPIRWTTPDGLPVMQAYREVFGQRVKVHWQGREVKVMLAVDGSRLDGRGQANGIAPNFVHSLDGAHLRAVARGAKEADIDHLAVIHDSFGTHAANTDRLVSILRDTFVEQYEPDVLARFRDELAAQLPPEFADKLPALPRSGDLQLSDTRRSSYLFA